MKTISQNPDRYSKVGSSWVISANGDSPNKGVTPLTLTTTPLPFTLKPYLKSNGIIVKAGEHYLISETTLIEIESSANPHYDIKQNGVVIVKDKEVKVGKTIPIIEITINNLSTIGDGRDIRNRNAGIASVDYIYEGEKIDGVPKGLIDQINYTLIQDVDRPMDKFSIYELQLGDDVSVYNILPLNVTTAQIDGILDKVKLESFLSDIKERLKILNTDFQMIKGVFLEGKEPSTLGRVNLEIMAETNPAEDSNQIVYKYSTTTGVQTTPTQKVAEVASSAATQLDADAPPITPVVKHYKMTKKRDIRSNTIPVYKANALGLPAGTKSKYIKILKEGNEFWGYLFKDSEPGMVFKIWAVYKDDKKTLIGYGYADSNDFVEEIT